MNSVNSLIWSDEDGKRSNEGEKCSHLEKSRNEHDLGFRDSQVNIWPPYLTGYLTSIRPP